MIDVAGRSRAMGAVWRSSQGRGPYLAAWGFGWRTERVSRSPLKSRLASPAMTTRSVLYGALRAVAGRCPRASRRWPPAPEPT